MLTFNSATKLFTLEYTRIFIWQSASVTTRSLSRFRSRLISPHATTLCNSSPHLHLSHTNILSVHWCRRRSHARSPGSRNTIGRPSRTRAPDLNMAATRYHHYRWVCGVRDVPPRQPPAVAYYRHLRYCALRRHNCRSASSRRDVSHRRPS